MNVQDLGAQARAILAANDRGGYTVPSEKLYPFQWNWDSAFVAMGFARHDVPRALTELERLTDGQWADGMIPHIVFHMPSDSYFPGPDVWRTEGRGGRVRSSGITQPPVFGIALADLAARAAPGDAPRIAPLFDAAMAFHRWWYAARDPEGTGLVALLHPWESGSDNSPNWDIALSRVPTTTDTPVRRKDTGHVDPAMRPRDEDYQRFIHLVDCFAACGWDPGEQWRRTPFKVACVQTTAILLRAGEDLERLARTLGRDEDAAELAAFNALSRKALLARWSTAHARFLLRDLISGTDVEAATHSGFIPLLALDLPDDIARAAEAEMRRWSDGMAVLFPTTPADDPAFEAKRYWRGPCWPIINWLLIDGLRRNGAPDFAERLRRSTLDAIGTSGFVEYFDPLTGEGCGGHGFSWTAASWLVLSDMTGTTADG